MTDSVSVIIPAYNEENNIEAAVIGVLTELKKTVHDYEILVIDDGSSDGTPEEVRQLAEHHPSVRLIQNRTNRGFGYSFRQGIKHAVKTYVTGYPGDADISLRSFGDVIRRRKDADLVVSYMGNPGSRSLLRRILSRSFVMFMNTVFGLSLRYYNGYFICSRDKLSKLPLRSDGLTLLAEATVRLIKSGASYKEIPFEHTERIHGKSKAVTPGSIVKTLETIMFLYADLLLTDFAKNYKQKSD